MGKFAELHTDNFKKYLASKRAQIWPGPGMLHEDKGRTKAADWFLSELDSYAEYLAEHGVASPLP